MNRKADAGQGLLLASEIAEIHIFKGQTLPACLWSGTAGVLDGQRHLQNLMNSFRRGLSSGNRKNYLGQHGKPCQDLGAVADGRDDGTHLQRAVFCTCSAGPQNQEGGKAEQQTDDREKETHDASGGDGYFHVFTVYFVILFKFCILPAERPDDLDTGKTFLKRQI